MTRFIPIVVLVSAVLPAVFAQRVEWTGPGSNGHFYELTAAAETWDAAKSEAIAKGGHLATITSAGEQAFLVASFGTASDHWIGFTDRGSEGNFYWITGEAVSYTNWGPGEPSNAGCGPSTNCEDVTVISAMYQGGWNDLGVGSAFPGPYFGIIEYETPPQADAVQDFSITANPNGVWSYGYTNSLGSGLVLHNTAQADYVPGVDRWWSSAVDPTVLGVSRNKTGAAITTNPPTATYPPDMLLMHPTLPTVYEVVRWTAPVSGPYSIKGSFAGLDIFTSVADTDVHVLRNSTTELVPVTVLHGIGTQAPFATTAILNAGDTIDFAVGVGPSGVHNNDSTGLKATITPIAAITQNPANSHWYQVVVSTGGWSQAKAAAASMTFQGMPGHLATITSSAENSFACSLFSAGGYPIGQYWIGGYQDHAAPDYSEPAGGWRWVTGESWNFTFWSASEPNNDQGLEDDLLMYSTAPCAWNDGKTNDLSQPGFLVEYEPVIAATPQTAVLGGGGSPQEPSPMSTEPVNTATGNYYMTRTDLAVPGKGIPFVFTRSYNSADSYSGPLGLGWTHSFNLVLVQNPDGSIAIKQGDGSVIGFSASGGNYSPSTPGVFDSLVKNGDGSFTLTHKNQTQVTFNGAGQLTAITDRNGNRQTLSYDASGNLTGITDTSLRSYTLSYDSSKHLTALADPSGRTVHYAYDASGHLASVTDPAGGIITFTYDGGSRLASATDPRANVFLQNSYDSQGRVIAQTNARNFTTTFAYNAPSAGMTTITDPLGNVTQQVSDSSFRFIKQIDALGGVTSYSYGSNNLRPSVTDPLGRVQSFAYDANGNLTGATDANGKTTQFFYDPKNNLTKIIDRLNRTTQFAYDSKGNLLSLLDAAGNTSSFTYDSFGQALTAKNARSFTTSFSYDAAGNLVQVTDALGGTVQLAYDTVGRLLSVKNQLGNTTVRTYDADNRLLSIKDPLANLTQFAYDSNGNMTQLTDANGKITKYAYDATNKLMQVTDAIGGITLYAYNGNTDLVSVTDAKGHTTNYAYDPLRRLKTTTDPLSRQKQYGYDAVGNITSTLDGNNKINSFGYDTLNRLVSMALSDGKSVAYTYDALGNRLSMTDWRGSTHYKTDLLNRVTSVTTPDSKTVGYSYDAIGNRTTLSYPSGKPVQYQYDALNRLLQVTDWNNSVGTYSYDAAGNLTKTMVTTTATNNQYPPTAIYSYDAANRLTKIINTAKKLTLSSFGYALDNVGNRIQVTDVNNGVTKFGYDGLYRLTSWTNPSSQLTQYIYDAVGNRLSLVAPSGTTNYSYDAADQLLTAGSTTFAYDGNGNQITKTAGSNVTSYGWDVLNRLTSVVVGSNNTQYRYDGDGNRISQQIPAGTYQYVNDSIAGLPVVLDENGPDGIIDYTYGQGMIAAYGSAFQSFYQVDGLESAADVVNQTGTAQASYTYDPWGQATATLDVLGTKNKYRFTGEALDPASGLVYLRTRYYDSGIGRFVTPDKKRSSLHGTRYQYGLANPTRYFDPSGLDVWDWLDAHFSHIKETQQNYLQLQQRIDECNSPNSDPTCSDPDSLSQRQQNEFEHYNNNAGQATIQGFQVAYPATPSWLDLIIHPIQTLKDAFGVKTALAPTIDSPPSQNADDPNQVKGAAVTLAPVPEYQNPNFQVFQPVSKVQ